MGLAKAISAALLISAFSSPVNAQECVPEYSPEVTVACDADLERYVNDIEIIISRQDFTMRVDATLYHPLYPRCTMMEQRAIIGKRDWRTPAKDTTVSVVHLNPYWFPTKNILDSLKEKYGDDYIKRFDHGNGMYMVNGPDNPLGNAKLILDDGSAIMVHGTPDKDLFDYSQRDFSHGCVRVEDEVGLVRLLDKYVGFDCDASCIDATLVSGKTKMIRLNHPVKLIIK